MRKLLLICSGVVSKSLLLTLCPTSRSEVVDALYRDAWSVLWGDFENLVRCCEALSVSMENTKVIVSEANDYEYEFLYKTEQSSITVRQYSFSLETSNRKLLLKAFHWLTVFNPYNIKIATLDGINVKNPKPMYAQLALEIAGAKVKV